MPYKHKKVIQNLLKNNDIVSSIECGYTVNWKHFFVDMIQDFPDNLKKYKMKMIPKSILLKPKYDFKNKI